MNKKTIIIILVLLIIIVISGILIYSELNKSEQSFGENIVEIGKNETINNEVNDIQNNITNEITNTLENNVKQNSIGNTTSSETFEDSPKTSEEKAINISKKDWKNEDGVKFSVEGINENGAYIVAVRDIKTTKALAFYTVNVSDSTFTKREMN